MAHTESRSNYDKQVDIARSIFLHYDQELLIRKFRLQADAHWIRLTYLNIPCRVSRSDGRVEEQVGGLWQECRSFNTVMTIYDLLCHHKGPEAPSLLGDWCTVGHFVVTGVTNTGTFTGKYADQFQDRVSELNEACLRLGGIPQPAMAGADVTCNIPVTPFFPILLQFRDGDDEFPPQFTILWDRNTPAFLHFETTFYLQGDLLERLSRLMD